MLTSAKNLFASAALLFASHTAIASTVVGSTPAEFNVSGGQASYSIPIQVAPGRGGMQPDLSLNYTGGGNGVLGVGWSLGGLSSIHRCAANLEQDGFIAGITFSDKDRYCLDGQRLIPVNGTSGGVGTEYKTEVDGYSQIISHGGSVNNPSYWVAKTKAGQVITFGGGSGNSGNASLTFQQGTTAWGVREINDSTGNNPVTYEYFIDGNTQYLDEVIYTNGKVIAIYESRPDVNTMYFQRAAVQSSKRLYAISVYQNTTLLRVYNTSYSSVGSANRSHLTNVQQCAASGECLQSTSFKWLDTGDGSFAQARMYTDIHGSGWTSSAYERYFQDFNGDGVTDFGLSLKSEAKVSIFLGQGDGSFAQTRVYTDIHGSGWTSSAYERYFQDFNGDGIIDFGLSLKSEAKVSVFLGQGDGSFAQTRVYTDIHGSGWTSSAYERYFQDFNGDGIIDFGLSLKSEAKVSVFLGQGDGSFAETKVYTDIHGSGWTSSAYERYFQDFNGDGIIDFGLSLKSEAKVSVFLGQGDGSFAETKVYTDIHGSGWTSSAYERYFQDFNGDGVTDFGLSLKSEAKVSIFLGQGDGSFAQTRMYTDIHGSGWTSSAYERYFQDFNGDGVIDFGLSLKSEAKVSVFLGLGDGSFAQTRVYTDIHGSGWASSAYERYFQDFNGDGVTDFGLSLKSEAKVSVFLGDSGINLVEEITDSSTNTTELKYKPLTDPTVYTKGTGAQYPVVDLQYPQYVVSQVKTSNGVGGTSTVNYQYEGLKMHVRGRGSYGYAKITESYADTGKSQETYFNQTAFPLAGNVDRVVEKLNGQVINESQKTFAVAANNGVYTVNLDQSVDKSYELNGDLVTTVTTSHSNVDAYGNIGTVNVTTSGNGANGVNESFTKSTDSTYYNDTTNWYLGRLSESTVTHQAPNQANQQRRSQFTYDSSTGLLNSESVVSMATGLPLTTTSYQYDAYGHKTQVTVSAPSSTNNETSRTSTTTYNSEGKPTQSCNQLNQCESYTYTPEGWVQSTTGPNGITTSWEYDGFGRKTKEIRADGTETTIAHHFAVPLSGTAHCGILATHAYTCSISQITGSQPAIVQYDALGRELRKIATGFDGRLIYSDTEYNHLAQVTRVSRNYFMDDQIYWANSEYDLLGRVTQMEEPAPHGTRNIIKTNYNGLLTTVTSGPEQRQKTTQTNAIGQVIYRGEEEGSYVEYTYTADGNLKTTTVAGDASTTITLSYDEFGRKIGMDDPDMGVWSYVYNAFGQLISQVDAKNQTTTMSYDILGRMVSRTDDYQGTAEATSTWTYGAATGSNPAPQGSIGKLLSETLSHPTNGGITKSYYYDHLGRPEEATTSIDPHTINGEAPLEQNFSTQTLYDSLGRVSRTIYPGTDNFYTENLYNTNGFLEKVRGLRSNSEQYDLSQLTPLVNDAITLASNYQTQANALNTIGLAYQQKIAQYQALVDNGTTTGSVDSSLHTTLQQHHTAHSAAVNTAQTDAASFYGHLNNTLVELQTVNDLINTQVQDYQHVVEQLTVLAEQTLAAADNSFQYERTLVRGGEVYTELVNDNQYTNYWQAIDVDASGRISAEVYGNGIVNDYTYNQATGQLQHIHSSLLSIDPIRHLEYQYDAYQNVTSRDDHANDIRETYEYDRLDRLTRTDITSATYISTEFNGSQTQDYDVLGNITHKSDVGAYTYGTGITNGAGIHAVVGAGNKSYQYDANGNMISGDGRTVAWSSFNKPTLITKNGKSADFSYDASRSRYKKVNHLGDTTLYVGSLYEKLTKNAGAANESIDEKHYIYANGQLVAEHIVSTNAGVQTRYLHKDALGSVDLVTDATANVVDRRSFDAWGKLRNLTWKDNEGINNPLYLTQLPFTNKGFTGHESIQEVDLIHMNGRVYDATLARFMSADPHIQEGALTQSYNRYSYVMNNPLKYTDPSGYFFSGLIRAIRDVVRSVVKVVKKVVKAIKPFVGVIVALALAAYCPTCSVQLIGAISGAAGAAANGGNILKGALVGAFTAGASKYIGNAKGVFGARRAFDIGRSLAHGVVGGVANVIQGGKFGAGFVSSAFTKFISNPIQGFAEKISTATGIASEIVGATGAALVGGTASVLGGGKFSNGAQTAAIQYLFNQIGPSLLDRTRKWLRGLPSRIEGSFAKPRAANYGVKQVARCVTPECAMNQANIDTSSHQYKAYDLALHKSVSNLASTVTTVVAPFSNSVGLSLYSMDVAKGVYNRDFLGLLKAQVGLYAPKILNNQGLPGPVSSVAGSLVSSQIPTQD